MCGKALMSPRIPSSPINFTEQCDPVDSTSPETPWLGISRLALTLIPDFQMFHIGDSLGLVLRLAKEISDLCSEFTGVCSVLISDFWFVWYFGTCNWVQTKLYLPFLQTHTHTHTYSHRKTHLHTHAPLPPLTFLFFSITHTHLTATHSVNMKAVCRPWVHNYCRIILW